jgi:hypothetical protein
VIGLIVAVVLGIATYVAVIHVALRAIVARERGRRVE